MKSKYPIIIIFTLILLGIGLYSSLGKKTVLVDRSITAVSISEGSFIKIINENTFEKYIIDGNTGQIGIVNRRTINYTPEKTGYSVDFLDSNSLTKLSRRQTFDLPRNAEIKFFDNDKPYYYYRFGLYNQLDGKDSLISPLQTSIYDAYLLKNGKILSLGEVKDAEDNKYVVGFFELDPITKDIILKHKLKESDYSTRAKDLLAYSGRFCYAPDVLSYVFERQGIVCYFDKGYGNLINELNTIDNNPVPTIVQFGNSNTYKRGNAALSNIAALIKNKIEFVALSAYPVIKERLLMDFYKNGEYRNSHQLNLDNINSTDVRFICQTISHTYIGTKKSLYLINTEQLLNNNIN